MEVLRPGVRLADRKAVGGVLLDKAFGRETAKVRALTSGFQATVSIDGWSTRSLDPVVVQERAKCCLEEHVFLAAYLLDPRFHGKRLGKESTELAVEYIRKSCQHTDVLMYLSKTHPFEESKFAFGKRV